MWRNGEILNTEGKAVMQYVDFSFKLRLANYRLINTSHITVQNCAFLRNYGIFHKL